MDEWINDVKGLSIKRYPSCILYTKNNKDGIQYKLSKLPDNYTKYISKYTVEDLYDWLKSHSSALSDAQMEMEL